MKVTHEKSQIRPSGFALLAMLVLAGCASSPRAVSASDSAEPAVTASTTFNANLRNSINKNVSDIVAKYKVPGAVVGIHLAGKGDYTATIGVGNIQTKATLDANMPWPLRSVTKSFVVTAILQLVQAGKLGLDDSIAKYTPSLPNANTVTVRELANMTSGLPEYTNEAFIKAYSADPDRQFTPEDLIGFAATEPAQFPPGTQHVYTNTNTVVLGKIVEIVTGMPISQVLQQNIFGPLKLTHTVYAINGNDWLKPHPTGYQVDNDKLVPQPNNFSIFAGAGAMISTLADLMIYAPALVNGALLDPQIQQERFVGAPLAKGPEYDQYGLGLGEVAGWWGHTGEGFGFTLAVMGQKGTDNSIVILMNLSNAAAHPPTKLLREIAATIAKKG